MPNPTINKSTIHFLKHLAQNNNREWFAANKQNYMYALQNMSELADALIKEMNKHDRIANESGKKSLYRIYKDVRFSKDKSPYSPRFAFGLQRATKQLRGGYYVHIEPGKSYLACGFFGPNSDDLKRIRQDIEMNYPDWKKIIQTKKIINTFGAMQGEQLKTAPQGYSQEHPAIELLRYKQFIFRHTFSEQEVIAENFVSTVNQLFKTIRPWLDYMSEVLTTDSNGIAR